MRVNRRLIAFLLSVVFIITACFSASCSMTPSNNNSNTGNAPSFSKSRYEYDIRVGGDFLIFGIENLDGLVCPPPCYAHTPQIALRSPM